MTELNKVDQAIQDRLLRYPTICHNRFQALTGIITESVFEWDDNGCLVNTCDHLEQEPATPETVLEEFRGRLAEAEKRAAAEPYEYLARLNLDYVTTARRNLADAQFVLANLEVYTTTFTGCTVSSVWNFLFKTNHYGVNQYWNVNNKPEYIDEDWRKAIYEWFEELLPSVNSLFGVFSGYVETGRPGGWRAQKGYEEIFNWVYAGRHSYQTDKEAARRKKLYNKTREILGEGWAT